MSDVREQTAAWISDAAGATLHRDAAPSGRAFPGPTAVTIDSRDGAGTDDAVLFVGIPGARVDGGAYAADVLRAGAWGVLVTPEHVEAAEQVTGGAILVHDDPVAALGALARAWRRQLGAIVVGITGSVGKTSTKDLLAALVGPHRRTVATQGNYNTEIGLPLTVLGAPAGTEVLILEMGMRGPGEIAQLAAIAEPDIGVITNVAPVHVERLGSIEAIAQAKAELLYGLAPGGTAIVPADERLLDDHRPHGIRVVTVGPGGDVERAPDDLTITGEIPAGVLRNLPAAVAAAQAIGVEVSGAIDPQVSEMRGQRLRVADDVVVIVDCYNANPLAMTVALDDLAETATGRRIAVLGDMLELGVDELRYHAEVGAHARSAGVELLVAVGPLSRHTGTGFGGAVRWVATADEAAALVPTLVEPGDTVLLKASRGIGLERVADALAARNETA